MTTDTVTALRTLLSAIKRARPTIMELYRPELNAAILKAETALSAAAALETEVEKAEVKE